MMVRPAPLTAAALIVTAFAPALRATAPCATSPRPQTIGSPDRLVVHLRAVPDDPRLGATGLPDFERACVELGATRLSPLAPIAARHADPATFHALGLDRIVRLELASDEPHDLALARLRRSPDVERADATASASAAKLPNDPLWGSQWSLQNDKLAMPKAWNIATDATGVPIAVLDGGCDLNHVDFRANRWINTHEINRNGIDDDGNGYIDDRFGYDFVTPDGDPTDEDGHGTQVTGVLGAVGDNSLSISGVCWNASVMTCRVLDASGNGTFDHIAEGIIYAADNGARVSNMSFVSLTDDATLGEAIEYARSLDVVQVAAAGNFGDTTPTYPAAYDGVLAVIGTDSTDSRMGTSSHGSWCDVAAPGDAILTLRKGGNTTTVSGTSFAAPHVAGLAALVRKINPDLDRRAVELTLSYSSEDFGPPGFDDDFGWGRVNGELALEKATMLTTSTTSIPAGGTFTLTLDSPDDAGFTHVLLASSSDRVPGIPLSSFDPADPRTFPLNDDWLLEWLLATPINPFFVGFQGSFDGSGLATASVDLPPHIFMGSPLDFAYVTFDPADLDHIVNVSEPARVWIQ